MRFSRAAHHDEPQLSLVPLIDVVLVILIFLSVTTTFSSVGQLKIDLPEGEAERLEAPQTLHIAITANGQLFIDGVAVSGNDVEAIEKALARHVPAQSDPLVVIEADAATPHQRVIDALRAAQRVGLGRVSFAVERRG